MSRSQISTKRWNEENTVEHPIIEWLESENLGWRFVPAADVTQLYRHNDQEALLLPILRQKLRDLNPDLITDDERADRVLTRLRGERSNEEWFKWMRNEKTEKFASDENYDQVKLFDFENIENNDFLVTNQFWLDGGEKRIRTDILLFVNGIPLVNIEAKTTARDWHNDWTEGARQCGRYLKQAPRLYDTNVFCVGVNEITLRYGVPGVKFHHWQKWRSPAPHLHVDEADELKSGIFGLCDRGNLLDMLQNFVVFDTDEGKRVKKVARWQQFGAANEIVKRALETEKPSGWRRGLVWHTQGSGKSLTMLFAARKLWFHEDLNQPTILIIVDREQLEDQMSGQFYRANMENCYVAESRDDLISKLRDGEGYRGIIITIMHKFEIGDFQIDRQNVIVMADEAHRTQDGDLAMAMRHALQEASLFGFTGTPIEIDDRNTPRQFGRELGTDDTGVTKYERYLEPRYTIADSIGDGATLPLNWIPSPRDWKLWGKELDKKFEETFADLPEGEREQLKKENSTIEIMVKLPDRVEDIAKEIATHFTENVRPNKFKAMLVCYDKETVALYKTALDELLGDEVSIAIFSEDPKRDDPKVKELYLGDAKRKKAIREFRKLPSDKAEDQEKEEERWRRAEIIIVCDMLLTGFDAPIVQTMYLDKGLKNHTLLQAIARVNRPYNEIKKRGFIVDFWGVFSHLNEALRYEKSELGDVAFPLKRLQEEFKIHVEVTLEIFKDFKNDGSHRELMKILGFLNKDEPSRDKFENGFKQCRMLYELLEPDPFLKPHKRDYVWLCKLFMVYCKKFYPKDRFETDAEDGAKTRELIREHIDLDKIKQEFPTYTLDENYLSKLDDKDPDAKALDIEAMLAAELKVRVDGNPDFEPLSEKLKRIIARKRNGAIQGIALISALEEVANELVDLISESKKPIAETIIKIAKGVNGSITDEQANQLALAIIDKANELCFPNWFYKSDVKKDLNRAFIVILAKEFKDLGLHRPDSGFVKKVVDRLISNRFVGDQGNSDD